jgi:hypothetical protein
LDVDYEVLNKKSENKLVKLATDIAELSFDVLFEERPPKVVATPPEVDPQDSDYVQVSKNKASGENFIFITDIETGNHQVINPNGRFIPHDDERFERPNDEIGLEDLLLSGKIKKVQAERYREYVKSISKQPRHQRPMTGDGPLRLPHGTPKALLHTLEVIFEIKKNGLSRSEATNKIAQRSGVYPQTILDKYCRQLGKSAAEFDRLLQEPKLTELKSILEKKYSHDRSTIISFFEDLV